MAAPPLAEASLRIGIDARKLGEFGVGTYAAGLLDGLAALDGPEEYVAFVRPEWRDRVPSPVRAVVTETPNYSVRELFVMGRAISRERLDLFHSAHFVLPWTTCPSIATIHDLIPLHFPLPGAIARLYYGTMIRRAVRKSVRILTGSESSKTQITAELRCRADRIVVTPYGIDAIHFETGPPETRYGRYFLFVGNDKPHKNIDVLLNAIRLVRAQDPDLQLVVAGASFDRLSSLAGVHLTGFVSEQDLASLYRGALALVIPSQEEGFGLPAAEAMASGAPVITSTAAALLEVTGEAALHADTNDPRAFADAMKRVANDESLRKSLAARGVERARLFTWGRCAALTREVYRELAPSSRS